LNTNQVSCEEDGRGMRWEDGETWVDFSASIRAYNSYNFIGFRDFLFFVWFN
jgi:primase-polymerase (primpol)-like protein